MDQAIANIAITAAGWLSQGCFFSRSLIQWVASERVRRSIVPEVFWILSIVGSLLGMAYVWLGKSHDLVFAGSYAFNVVVYARNIRLARHPESRMHPLALAALGFTIAALTGWALSHDQRVAGMWEGESVFWLVAGTTGQVLWAGRFLLQWIIAERTGRADLTPLFWWVSLIGSLLLLGYTIHKVDWVLIAGQALNPIVFIRNLVLDHEARHGGPPGGDEESGLSPDSRRLAIQPSGRGLDAAVSQP